MALSVICLRYFSMLYWIECFLAQHTLQDLHRILIQFVPGNSKTRVCCVAICMVFSYCKLLSLIILNHLILYIHYTIPYIVFLHGPFLFLTESLQFLPWS